MCSMIWTCSYLLRYTGRLIVRWLFLKQSCSENPNVRTCVERVNKYEPFMRKRHTCVRKGRWGPAAMFHLESPFQFISLQKSNGPPIVTNATSVALHNNIMGREATQKVGSHNKVMHSLFLAHRCCTISKNS